MEEVSSILNISISSIKIIIRKHNGVADNYTKYEIQECRKIWTDTIKKNIQTALSRDSYVL